MLRRLAGVVDEATRERRGAWLGVFLGLGFVLQTVGLVQKSMNPSLKISGILLTMFDGRTKLSQEVVRQVSEYFHDRVFKTIIPRNVRLSEAPSHGLPVMFYDPTCIGSRSYEAVAQELIERG